ncbi:MAG: hypothetical protein AB7K24_30470 [Gemmataceae bacterium]
MNDQQKDKTQKVELEKKGNLPCDLDRLDLELNEDDLNEVNGGGELTVDRFRVRLLKDAARGA